MKDIQEKQCITSVSKSYDTLYQSLTTTRFILYKCISVLNNKIYPTYKIVFLHG